MKTDVQKKKIGFRKTAMTKLGDFWPAREGMTAGAGVSKPATKQLPKLKSQGGK